MWYNWIDDVAVSWPFNLKEGWWFKELHIVEYPNNSKGFGSNQIEFAKWKNLDILPMKFGHELIWCFGQVGEVRKSWIHDYVPW